MLSKRILVLVSLLLISFLIVGCGTVTPITNHPPEIISTAITTATVGMEYTYDVDATDADALTYSLTTRPGGMVINSSTGVITWTPTDTESVHVFVVVSDGVLSAEQEFNIAVTDMIPMTITAVIPTFKVGESAWFTINMTAYDDKDKLVVASFGWPTSTDDGAMTGVLETDGESDLNFVLTGPGFKTGVFTMKDATAKFRGTFDKAGTYETTIYVKTFSGDVVLCSLPITIEVIDLVHNITKVPDKYYHTIQAAINDAELGNTILVSAGVYEEDVTMNVDSLILRSVDEHGAEIKGVVRIDADAVTIEDFYINFDSTINAPVDLGDINGVTIKGNKVEGGSDAGGISSWTGPVGLSGDVLIEDNEIIKGCIGLKPEGKSVSITIRNNTMTDPADEGIWVWKNSGADLTIENNIVTGSGLNDVKIVDKPLSINVVTDEIDMAQAILGSNSGIYDVNLEWLSQIFTQ